MRKNIIRTIIAAVLICSMLTVPAFAESAVVTGNDVNMRSGPGMNYRVVDCLPRNTPVQITDRSNSDWYAVDYNGITGFMSSRYLSITEGGVSVEISGNTGTSGTTGSINAMYVRFRSGPSSSSSILGEYNRGKEITITGTSGGWTACIIDGQSGYVYSQYVSTGYVDSSTDNSYSDDGNGIIVAIPDNGEESVPEPAPLPVVTPEPSVDPAPDSGGNITVTVPSETPAPAPTPEPTPEPTPDISIQVQPVDQTEGYIDGDYVRFRTGPGTSYGILGSYNRGKTVLITGVSGDWTACTIDGQSGYVYSQYVKKTVTQQPEEEQPETSTPEVEVPTVVPSESKPGYVTGNNVRFRSSPSMSSEILGELFYGNNVTITGTSGDWTAITYNSKSGYVYSQYIKEGEYSHVSTGGSELGREIADYALQFVGYNYCWGGSSPSTGFDCSGLMYYVYKQFGYTLNRVAADQARNGVHVDASELQPGDILCFYSGGDYIGHVGMYIGNNMFVHAANSISGVITSEISGYYASRGFEARRIV